MAHAILSPSSAVRWMTCPGSVALCAGLADEGSRFADEGTAAHDLAARCLLTGAAAADFLGQTLDAGGNRFTVTAEMAGFVQGYVDHVTDLANATHGELLVEQLLPISSITGEADAHGTADAVILAGPELIVVDLKFGRGVLVDAEHNPQLQIYALAALREYSFFGDFDRVRMVIHQPRLGGVSEWVQSADELETFGEQVAEAAEFTRHPDAALNPTDKGCKFCRAKATCPALRNLVLTTVADDFVDLSQPLAPVLAHADERLPASTGDHIAECLSACDLIEGWCKAVRAEAESRLLAGESLAGWKLVQGKRGARAWSDPDAAEKLLKETFRLKTEQVYDLKLISPTTAEKLHKAGEIGPRQWPRAQALICQPEGRPSVAPESDKRPALAVSAAADEFTDLTQE